MSHKAKYFLLEITVFLLLIAASIFYLFPTLYSAFMTNIYINSAIALVLIIGVGLSYKILFQVTNAVHWTDDFRNRGAETKIQSHHIPRLIKPTATLLKQRQDQMGFLQLNSGAMRAILDGLSVRLEESRETLRYFVGLLVFLGLLGTFWGLMQTILSVGAVIDDIRLATGGGMAENFEQLKQGLKAPLQGMGTAFSSSLFGLSGSLVLGYFGLRVGQAQNLFYQGYEEWLSGLTRLSGSVSSDGDSSNMSMALSLIEQSAESIERLQMVVSKSETSQERIYVQIGDLNDRLGGLVDSLNTQQDIMKKLAENQLVTRQLLERVHDNSGKSWGADSGGDKLTLALGKIDNRLGKLLEIDREQHGELVKTVKNELRIVARTISNSLVTGAPPPRDS